MAVSYDLFTNLFLSKVTEYELIKLDPNDSMKLIDGFLRKAIVEFDRVAKLGMAAAMDDDKREINVNLSDEDSFEVANIVSDGMVVQWIKPYLYRQEILENILNTRDFSTYSPAELLKQVGAAYNRSKLDYTQAIREYSYNHGNLASLHL